MTLNEMLNRVREILPNASVGEDNDGDGTTWDTAATVMEITDAAYDRLQSGDIEPSDLKKNDIVEEWDAN